MASKRECPTCRTIYTGDDKLFCPRDGSRLLDAAQSQRPDDTLVGRVIAGRFVLERRLGKGGMGVVYLANHNVLKRVFAVKLLRREFVSNERALARFFREARVASSVDHPNIVSIYDYGQTERGEPYLVMEYVEGVLLYQAVVDSPTHNLMPSQAVDVALQVGRAIEHAHQRGVVHRDIKPDAGGGFGADGSARLRGVPERSGNGCRGRGGACPRDIGGAGRVRASCGR